MLTTRGYLILRTKPSFEFRDVLASTACGNRIYRTTRILLMHPLATWLAQSAMSPFSRVISGGSPANNKNVPVVSVLLRLSNPEILTTQQFSLWHIQPAFFLTFVRLIWGWATLRERPRAIRRSLTKRRCSYRKTSSNAT